MVVRKRGDQWCVFSKDGERIACHDSREAAIDQLRAIEANSNTEMSRARLAYINALNRGVIDINGDE